MTEEYKERLAQERVNQVSKAICKSLDGIPSIAVIRAWIEYDDGDQVALQIHRKDSSASDDPEPEQPARPKQKRFNWLRKILPFLATFPLIAASTTIDCGSPSDSNFNGGTALTLTGSTLPDTTLRFSTGQPFSYRLIVTGPTQVTLRFTALPQAPASVFSVQVNNQTVVDHIDLASEGGLTGIIERNVIVSPDGSGVLNIVFNPNVRAAVVSSITLTPLADLIQEAAKRAAAGSDAKRVGDYFAVDNALGGRELKCVRQDVDSDGAGLASIWFDPPLRRSPNHFAPIMLDRPTTIMRMSNDDQGAFDHEEGGYASINLSLVEVF
jgi:hypothetical protein